MEAQGATVGDSDDCEADENVQEEADWQIHALALAPASQAPT